MTIRRLLILTKANRPESEVVAKRLAELAAAKGMKSELGVSGSIPANTSPTPDLIVAVGGDGTLLRTLQWVKDSIPVVGVNVGARGALSEITPSDLETTIDKIARGDYKVEKRTRLRVSLDGGELT